jgi:hypothetical protein
MRSARAVELPLIERRFMNTAVKLKCPDCHKPLIGIVSVRGEPERDATIRCGCGFSVNYSGPGVVADRRGQV